MADGHRAVLYAALACTRVESAEPEIVLVRRWLDSWSGLGAVVIGMLRHGYDLSLTSDENGWRATFLHRSHVYHPWVGQVLRWWSKPWTAVQDAAWRALNTPFAGDFSVSEDPLP